MRRIVTLICAIMLAATSMTARERTESEMLNIARETLFPRDAAKVRSGDLGLRQVRINRQLGIFAAEGYGFVVINRDDTGRTILGLSATEYDADNLPDGLRWWIEKTEEALANGTGISYYADILNVDETEENFITTTWNQNNPYNYKCPLATVKGKTSKTPTGCVATALAQVMNYYKYPAKGRGTSTYSVEDDNGTKEYKANVDGIYNYKNLKNNYSSSDTDHEDISTLMFDAGKACKMAYNLSGSGANLFACATGTVENLGYDSLALEYYNCSFFDDEELFTIIRNELLQRRPIIFGGVDSVAGGHAFLFTGINTDGKVWVNWGWSGKGDGWYAIDHLRVNEYNFNGNLQMLAGFNPQETPSPEEENKSLLFYLPDYELNISKVGKDILINPFYYGNYSIRWFVGYVRMALENIDKEEISYCYIHNQKMPIEPLVAYGFEETKNIGMFYEGLLPNKMAEGNYRLWVERKADGESEWKPIKRASDHSIYSWFSVASDGTITINNTEPTTEIRSTKADNNSATTDTYDLNGRKLNAQEKGSANGSRVVIVKNNATVTKRIQ